MRQSIAHTPVCSLTNYDTGPSSTSGHKYYCILFDKTASPRLGESRGDYLHDSAMCAVPATEPKWRGGVISVRYTIL